MKTTPRSAFSLLEMFIVMTIIVLLIALLMPTIRGIRSAANTAVCASQLSQIYKGAQIRKFKVGVAGQETFGPDGWTGQIMPFINSDGRALLCPEDDDPSNGNDALVNYGLMTNVTGMWGNPSFLEALAPGKWCVEHDSDVNGNPYPAGKYELWFEDMGGSGGGDDDVNDVQLLVDTTTPGQIAISVARQGSAGYTNNVININTGQVVIQDASHNMGAIFIIPVSGVSSYAVNKNLNDIWGNAGKIWALDYQNALVCDPGSASWTYPPTFARHRLKTKLNVLYGDGSVRTAYPRDVDPALATNGITLWQK